MFQTRAAANSKGGSGWVYATANFVGADSVNTYWRVVAKHNGAVIAENDSYVRPFTCKAHQAAQAFADEVFHSIMSVCLGVL